MPHLKDHLTYCVKLHMFLVLVAAIVAGSFSVPLRAQAAPSVKIRIEGRFEEPDREALLKRLNEIRKEACEEGVQNPETGEPLTAEDFVPAEWSYELEKIAVTRAVEAAALRDHMRPDGTECFSLLPDSSIYSMETLAWGYGSAMGALEGWYSEKEAYVGETGTPAGHYIALITPANRYVAIADLRTEAGGDTCAGAYGNRMREQASEERAAESEASEERPAEDETTAERPAQDGPAAERESADMLSAEADHWEIPLTGELLTAIMNGQQEAAALRLDMAARSCAGRFFRGFPCRESR